MFKYIQTLTAPTFIRTICDLSRLMILNQALLAGSIPGRFFVLVLLPVLTIDPRKVKNSPIWGQQLDELEIVATGNMCANIPYPFLLFFKPQVLRVVSVPKLSKFCLFRSLYQLFIFELKLNNKNGQSQLQHIQSLLFTVLQGIHKNSPTQSIFCQSISFHTGCALASSTIFRFHVDLSLPLLRVP